MDPPPPAPHEEASSWTPGRNVPFWALKCTASLRQAVMRLRNILKRLQDMLMTQLLQAGELAEDEAVGGDATVEREFFRNHK